MTDRIGEPLDETMLRRALRLEADERPPLFDPAAIAAAARVRPRIAIVSAAVAVGLGALGAVAVWSAFAILLPTVAVDAFDIGLGLLAMLAVAVSGVADLVQQPVVPLSLVAALAIATAHELRERVSHVNAS
ncbi:MAG: hypothetical protein E6I44_11735 [Chloroflexi bacterium]|nr:MAG: hypothetical protein E6I44_11735 [Chloroflexota bacterium]